MNCPKCKNESMNSVIYETIEVEKCGTCKGLFLNKGEFDRLLQKQLGNKADTLKFSSTSDVMDLVSSICPLCDLKMIRKTDNTGINIDSCTKCKSIFLDQGELATFQLYK